MIPRHPPHSTSQTIHHPELSPRLGRAAQTSLLAALGAVSSLLTLVYVQGGHPTLLLFLIAPLWSIWLQSFVNWLRAGL